MAMRVVTTLVCGLLCKLGTWYKSASNGQRWTLLAVDGVVGEPSQVLDPANLTFFAFPSAIHAPVPSLWITPHPPSRSCINICPTPAGMMTASPFLVSVTTLSGLSFPPKHRMARPASMHNTSWEMAGTVRGVAPLWDYYAERPKM